MSFLTYLDLREAEKVDEWIVLNPLIYETKTGMQIKVPKGFITDLASIPQALRSLIDVNGISRSPAVIHDYLYCMQPFDRDECDKILVEALESRGASTLECDTFYAGVRLGGASHWDGRMPGLQPGYDMVPDNYWETHL